MLHLGVLDGDVLVGLVHELRVGILGGILRGGGLGLEAREVREHDLEEADDAAALGAHALVRRLRGLLHLLLQAQAHVAAVLEERGLGGLGAEVGLLLICMFVDCGSCVDLRY